MVEGGHATGPGMHEILAAVNLLIVIGIVYVMGRVGIMASLKNRSEETRKKLFESKEELEKVSKNLDEVKAQLADFDNTKANMMASVKKDAEALGAKILEEASVGATKILEDAKLAAGNEVRGAAADLKTVLIRETLQEARNLLTNNKDKQAMLHKQLFESLNSEMKETQN